MEDELAGSRVLITGATRGIGRAIAVDLAAQGCSVGGCARSEDELGALREELLGAGAPSVTLAAVDVTDLAAVRGWVEACADELGGVDGVVANVGGLAGPRGLEATPEDWEATFRLNVTSALALVQAARPWLASAEHAAAVLIGSVSARHPGSPMQYGLAKAALEAAAAQLARDLAAEAIRVNVVAPGSILFKGGGWASMQEHQPERFARFAREELPAGRLGAPEEVARVVTFLLSPAASWVNGATIAVDGAQDRAGARP